MTVFAPNTTRFSTNNTIFAPKYHRMAKFYLVVDALSSGQKYCPDKKKLSRHKNCPDKKIIRTKKLSGKKIALTKKLSGQKNCSDKFFLSASAMPLIFFPSIRLLIFCLAKFLSIFLSKSSTKAWFLFQKYFTFS